ncbi:MAG: D-aminoacylase [Spirochaetales bacterium]|nr:D-aminoacylase [Spirochaetales bacterium]
MKKTAVINGLIVDGTGEPSYKGSLLIEGDRIIGLYKEGEAPNLEEQADRVIDAKGQVVAPGFIDSHSHSDLKILLQPLLELKLRQGITTEVLGQDGVAMAPLPKKHIADWRKNIGGLDGDSDDIDWNYRSVEGYLDLIRGSGSSSNSAYLVPHGNVRLSVMGFSEKKASSRETAQMCHEVRKAMDAGCVGLSSGLIYIPCAYGNKEELIEMCKVVAEYDGIFVVHQRSEANQILLSMDEIIDIGRESGVRVHFSHFKVCGKNNWHKADQVLAKIDSARLEGIKVTFDMYPYTAGSTMLSALLPPWAHVGGASEMLERLRTPEIREKIREAIQEKNCEWDNFVEFAGFDGIFITSVVSEKNQYTVGKSLSEIGEAIDKDPMDVLFDLLLDEENRVGMIDYYGSEEHLEMFCQREEMSVCTDGLLGGKVHPRAYGAFPRVISQYVRSRKILSLEEAIKRMTGNPARNFQLVDRGNLRKGYYADIVIFDRESFTDKGNYVDPAHFPTGLNYVMVNGSLVFDGEKYFAEKQGRFLSRGE